MSIRVLVVDDSAAFGRVMKLALEGIGGVEVAGICRSGDAALQRLRAEPCDLVTMDVEMPGKNGLDVLIAMRREGIKAAVVMVSSVSDGARELTVRALENGALDFVSKPQGESGDPLELLRERLAPLVAAVTHRKEVQAILRSAPAKSVPIISPTPCLCEKGDSLLCPQTQAVEPAAHGRSGQSGLSPFSDRHTPAAAIPVEQYGKRTPGLRPPAVQQTPVEPSPRPRLLKPTMVLIGVSTGGPEALARIIPKLPAKLPPVLIVQHMPPLFTQTLAEKLDSDSALHVKEAEDGEIALAGSVYLAPGGKHLKVIAGKRREIVLRITSDPPENNCRPAVDVLFRSAAAAFPGLAVAVILTGMGRDGTLGLRDLRSSGVFSIAQDELTCTVFGMPKEAIQAGLVDVVAPLPSIASEIVKAVG
ncbi:MAG TPA: chemotaxis-specific protein-glutamate methyltransferase CheB [Bryobacteraceae bacterium]|nr:chemotaxis-specific protein-glutamate methyltransferase CheB [Bryobacteraceae bacterium]